MKIRHILDKEVGEKTLKFVQAIEEDSDGKIFTELADQPDEWDHVRHIARNFYYAWDDGEEDKGGLYLGKYY